MNPVCRGVYPILIKIFQFKIRLSGFFSTCSEITDSHIEWKETCVFMRNGFSLFRVWRQSHYLYKKNILFFISVVALGIIGNFTSDRLSACIINRCCKLSVTKHLHETTKLKTMVINPYELFYSTSKPFTTSIFTHHETNRC